MASMTGEVRNAMRDLLADIVGLKHEVQASITAASLRKASLTESETAVRDDIKAIKTKLQAILKAIEDRANKTVSEEMKSQRENINTEILFLEDQHKRLEETEGEIRSKTSNISMKVMKDGRETYESSRSEYDQYKVSISDKRLQFVLHQFLASILEQIETFTMGEVKVIDVPVDQQENDTEVAQTLIRQSSKPQLRRSGSLDPVNTSFSRSNSSDPLKKSLSRSNSSQILKGQKDNLSRAASRNAGSVTTAKPASRPQTRQSKTSVDMRKNKATLENANGNALDGEPLRPVAGLKATFAARSTSEPLINLLSKERSAFIKERSKVEESLHPEIGYRETLHTKEHKDACYITGIAVLRNKNVVICDNVHDSLQMYNPESRQISELECAHPWGIAAVADDAVAVTLHYDHKIVLIKANQALEKLDKDIKLKCQSQLTYDVKYYDYRLYVLCINGDVHVMDIKGKEYNVIRTGMLPSVLKYFDVNVDKKVLVVSGDSGVACLNFQGLYLWHYRSKSSQFQPTGIAVSKGHVLVCDWENHCIVQIYEEGKKATTVIGDNLERPVVMAVDGEQRNFFLSQGDYDMERDKTRSIKVFELV